MALGDLRENECQNSYRSLRRARDERTSPSYRSVREERAAPTVPEEVALRPSRRALRRQREAVTDALRDGLLVPRKPPQGTYKRSVGEERAHPPVGP